MAEALWPLLFCYLREAYYYDLPLQGRNFKLWNCPQFGLKKLVGAALAMRSGCGQTASARFLSWQITCKENLVIIFISLLHATMERLNKVWLGLVKVARLSWDKNPGESCNSINRTDVDIYPVLKKQNCDSWVPPVTTIMKWTNLQMGLISYQRWRSVNSPSLTGQSAG